mmetsp:Transcript_20759/g.30569  ORF Transcript_20759/g.30569 Transcript_20759/m.30569 type:complete len:115 (-) Transcript_20759:631-975(-)
MARRLSGLQKEVLALYRNILREAARKDKAAAATTTATNQPSFHELLFPSSSSTSQTGNAISSSTTTSYAREEFRRQSQTVKRSDYKTIEYMMRKGQKHVNLLKMPGVTGAAAGG